MGLKLEIVGLECKVPEEIVSFLHSEIPSMNIEVHEIRDASKIKERSYDPSRGQYNAELVLIELSKFRKKRELILGIMEGDLFVRGFNFVFGLASPKLGAGLVSIHRLGSGEILVERLKKEVLHEIGHLLGLKHCSDPKCVMYFSNTVRDTDEKDAKFCPMCSRSMMMAFSNEV